MITLRLFYLVIFRSIRREWKRILLSSLGIACGVSIFIAVLDASQRSIRSFSRTTSLLHSPLEVSHRTSRISHEQVGTLARALAEDFDLIALMKIPLLMSASRTSSRGTPAELLSATVILSRSLPEIPPIPPDSIGISAEWARDVALNEGDPLLLTSGLDSTQALSHILPDDSLLLPSGTILGDAHLLGISVEGYQSLQLIPFSARAKRDPLTLARRLIADQALSTFFQVTSEESRTEFAENVLAAFRLNIFIMVGMTLLVGILTIFNSSQISMRSHLSSIVTLRALGASPQIIVAILLGESAIIGILGSVCGLTAGRPLSDAIAALFLRTTQEIYGAGGGNGMGELSWSLVFASLFVGTGTALLGGLLPALKTRSIAPTLAPPLTSLPQPMRRSSVAWYATASAALGAACYAASYFTDQVVYAHGSALFVVALIALISYPCLRLVIMPLRPLIHRIGGAVGLLATSGITSRLSLNSFAVATASCALALLIGLELMIQNFRFTLDDWIRSTIRADLYISSKANVSPGAENLLPYALYDEVRALPGTAQVVRNHVVDFPLCPLHASVERCGPTVLLFATDLPPGALRGTSPPLVEGTFSQEDFTAGSSILVSESLAARHSIEVGNRLKIFSSNPVVSGVIKDFGSDRGTIFVSYSFFLALQADKPLKSLGVYFRTRNEEKEKSASLIQNLSERGYYVQNSAALRTRILGIFDKTFEITYVLRYIVAFIAALSIFTCLLQLSWERKDEFAAAEKLGAPRSVLAASLIIGAGVLSIPILLSGLFGGTLLAHLLIARITPLSFGWTIGEVYPLIGYVHGISLILATCLGAAGCAALLLPRNQLSTAASE